MSEMKKRCPFCGSEPLVEFTTWGKWVVSCWAEKGGGHLAWAVGQTIEEAVERWNERKEDWYEQDQD